MMKRLAIITLLLGGLQLAGAAVIDCGGLEVVREPDAVVIHYRLTGMSINEENGSASLIIDGMQLSSYLNQPRLPFVTLWLEVPRAAELNLELREIETEFHAGLELSTYHDDQLTSVSHTGGTNLTGFATVGAGGMMRDLRLVPLVLQPAVVEQDGVRILKSASIRVNLAGDRDCREINCSREMDQLYETLLVNHGQFYRSRDESQFPRLLVVSAPLYANYIGDLLRWKRRAGFEVDYVTFDQMPGGGNTITNNDLDSWLTDYYAQYQPEYLILIGDQDGTYACPTFLIPEAEGEDYDVTDLQYSLKVGDDYMPDLLLGRLSVHDAPLQLLVIAEKIMRYEAEPYEGSIPDQEDWLENGLVVGGNFAEGGIIPVTPVLTSRWVVEKLLDNGYTQVDTVYYPPHISGEPMISNAINSGVSVVNYRGWADAEHWQRPSYSITDMNQNLNNGYMTPIMLSIVCNTGDFGSVNHEPCFAEAFLRLGNPGTPRGGVAVFAPSDLHTRSIYNNALNAGFYRGLFNEGIATMGGNTLRAKIDLYNAFPNEHEINGYVYFYFNVYNLLGDPSLRIRTSVPVPLTVTALDTLAVGAASLSISVTDELGTPLSDLLVTLVAGEESEQQLGRGRTDSTGELLLTFPRLTETGTLQLTVLGKDSYPQLTDIPVVIRPQYATLTASQWLEDGNSGSSGDGDGLVNPGETVAWFPTLQNSGSQTLPGVDLAATATDTMLMLQNSELSLGELLPGEEATSPDPLLIDVSQSVLHGWPLQLELTISGDGFSQITIDETAAVASRPYFVSHTLPGDFNQIIDPEEEAVLQLTLANDGDLSSGDLTGLLTTTSPQLTVVTATAQPIGVIDAGGETTVEFTVTGGQDILPGLTLPLQLELTTPAGFQQLLDIEIINGERLPGDPTGPDGYGYWAYESRDYNYLNRPSYDWIEIDTRLGGDGTRLWLDDDQSATLPLPFTFRYYGESFDTVTICSNGWLSMNYTWMSDFTNWMIPPGLGPSNLIMPFWDDLKPQYTPNEDSVWVPVFYKDMDDGRFVVEWSQTYNRYLWDSEPMEETFQAILYDPVTYPTTTGDSRILFQYRVIHDEDARANYATVGVTDHDHYHGLEVTFAQRYGPDSQMLADGTAILITTDEPQRVTDPQIILVEESPWLHSLTPQFNWDPGPLTGNPDVTYTLELALDDQFSQAVAVYGDIDTTTFEVTEPLEEEVLYYWRVTAHLADEDIPCVPACLSFQIDATPPVASLGLVENPVFPHFLDLGIISSEELAAAPWLQLTAADSTLVDSSQAEPLPNTDTGFHWAFNLEQLGEYLLTVQMVDAHGLPGSTQRDLGQAGGGYTTVHLGDGIRCDWLSGDPATLLEGDIGVQLIGNGAYRLMFPPAPGVICRLDDGLWRPIAPVGANTVVIHEGGTYARRLESETVPAELALRDNYPNPFNGSTRLEFALPATATVRLSVYNLLGQRVEVLRQGTLNAGIHQVDWRPHQHASGMYWAVLEVESSGDRATLIQKMLYLK